MRTPIHDFLNEYSARGAVRLHMPGHKGVSHIGIEDRDITEIDGADSLYHADGIIRESESIASELFGSGLTVYSTEGSSQCIKAMLYLAKLNSTQEQGYVLAGRNAHASFISAAALVGFDVEWLYPPAPSSYLSCEITESAVEEYLSSCERLPFAVYITSPDYLGNIADVSGLARACHKYSVPLIVDNAHGAYLKFLDKSIHPIDLGADMCCDSAHKTLTALTGAAYLHISRCAPESFFSGVKGAMALFGSTSPSYLIMESLDLQNRYIADGYATRLREMAKKIDSLKDKLRKLGYSLIGNERMKITLRASDIGYCGKELAEIFAERGVVCEFSDPDFIVFMLSADNSESDINALLSVLSDIKPRVASREAEPTLVPHPERRMSVREAVFSKKEHTLMRNAKGRVLAASGVSCPPAVSLIVAGEVIDEQIISLCERYGIYECDVVIE